MVRQRDKAAKPKAVKPMAAGLAYVIQEMSVGFGTNGKGVVAMSRLNVSTYQLSATSDDWAR
jgi:ABC-type cobalamin/Fe3+-siderophores transport system ATPase subunit